MSRTGDITITQLKQPTRLRQHNSAGLSVALKLNVEKAHFIQRPDLNICHIGNIAQVDFIERRIAALRSNHDQIPDAVSCCLQLTVADHSALGKAVGPAQARHIKRSVNGHATSRHI